MAEKKKKWIKAAVKPENKGKFKAKAEAAGKSTAGFAAEHSGDKGTLGKEARLAQTFSKMKHHSAKHARSKLYGEK